VVTDPIRPAELPDSETLTETVNDSSVYGRTGFHESFRGELSAPFHLLISLLFCRDQKKRRGGALLGGHLIE
jgi:hypothetical protein